MSFTLGGRTLSKVAVIGSGQIGPDIALYFAKVLAPYGVETVVIDVSSEALDRGRAKLEKKVAKGVESGAFTAAQQQEMLARVRFTSDYESVRDASLVIEAVTEDAALKRKIFAQVEAMVDESAILASNSSHLEPEAIFEDVRHPGRTAVIHYFFPAERNLVVEIVPGKQTDDAVTEWLLRFYEAIGKVPIRVESRYGYALDPVFEGLFLAALKLLDSGLATSKQIDVVAMRALGLGIGSFTAMNLTGGNPITAIGLDHYNEKIHEWFRTPDSLKDRVVSGTPWDAPKRGENVEVSAELERFIGDELRGAYFGLVCEIVDAGLISVSDFDLALELALDIRPAFRFMNEIGTAEALKLVRQYADRHPGFPVAKCLAKLGKNNKPFDVRVIQRRDVDGVAILTIRRPKVLNALNQSVFDELRTVASELKSDSKVKAVVLTGFGRKAFVSGADVNFLAGIRTAEEGKTTAADSQDAINKFGAIGKPTVAALNGIAFGGGLELAMACSVRVAVAGLKVLAGQPETNLGIIPGAGGTQRLPRIVGIPVAAELLRTGRPISTSEAVSIGLVSEAVSGELVDRAVQIARDLADEKTTAPKLPTTPMKQVPAELPPVDIGHRSRRIDEILCRAILDGAKKTLLQGLALEAELFGEVCATRDMRIGVEAFLKNGPRAKAEFVHA